MLPVVPVETRIVAKGNLTVSLCEASRESGLDWAVDSPRHGDGTITMKKTVLALALLLVVAPGNTSFGNPNVVLIMADDNG